MALVIGLACLSSLCLAGVYILPPPEERKDEFKKFTRIATDRTLLNSQAREPLVVSNVQSCMSSCEYDWTCKGVNVWTETDSVFKTETVKCAKSTEKPDPWKTVPGYILSRVESKIYVKDE